MIATLIACIACTVAVVTDLRTRRIPNAVTLPLVLVGLALSAFGGVQAVLHTLALAAALFACGIALHRTGWLGGGDVKLAIGVGTLLGFPLALNFILYSGIAGGVLALAIAILRGRVGLLGTQLRSAALAAVTRSGYVSPVASAPADERIPYALALFAGLICALGLPILASVLRLGH